MLSWSSNHLAALDDPSRGVQNKRGHEGEGKRMSLTTDTDDHGPSLGAYLAQLRTKAGMTLRQVEEATDKEISNAYLSQLEGGKIKQPSPNVLHTLSRVYDVSYEELMTRAGYLLSAETSSRRQARAATFAIKNVTPDEEEALLEYLKFLRFQRKRK